MSKLKDIIKIEAKRNKITLDKIAVDLEMSVPGFHKMFRTDSIKLNTFIKIAEILSLSPEELLSLYLGTDNNEYMSDQLRDCKAKVEVLQEKVITLQDKLIDKK